MENDRINLKCIDQNMGYLVKPIVEISNLGQTKSYLDSKNQRGYQNSPDSKRLNVLA